MKNANRIPETFQTDAEYRQWMERWQQEARETTIEGFKQNRKLNGMTQTELGRKAGISQGCVITKIDDTEVTSQATITNYVSTKKPGDEVTLEVYNGLTGKTFTATVTLSESSGD